MKDGIQGSSGWSKLQRHFIQRNKREGGGEFHRDAGGLGVYILGP